MMCLHHFLGKQYPCPLISSGQAIEWLWSTIVCSCMLEVIKTMQTSTRPNSVLVAYSAMAESGVAPLMCHCFCRNTVGLEILQGNNLFVSTINRRVSLTRKFPSFFSCHLSNHLIRVFGRILFPQQLQLREIIGAIWRHMRNPTVLRIPSCRHGLPGPKQVLSERSDR